MLEALLLTLSTTTLPNGLEVSVLSDPSMPVVATQLWYRVGAADETPGSRGLAHLFEHLMFGATSAYPKGEYSRFVTSAGGDDNAFTSADETVYVAAVPPAALAGVISREGDRMRNLTLDEAGLENEKKIVIEELRLRTENDPMSRLLVAAQRALLGDHPYALDASGSKEDVARASLASCRAFYDAHYRPNHAHLVVVGPVGLLLYSLTDFWGLFPSIGIGVLLLLPVVFVATAMVGIVTSSVWTIGYLTQVEQ